VGGLGHGELGKDGLDYELLEHGEQQDAQGEQEHVAKVQDEPQHEVMEEGEVEHDGEEMDEPRHEDHELLGVQGG